eukprot:scaffold20318_cov55-Attheya_sp.AAC.2
MVMKGLLLTQVPSQTEVVIKSSPVLRHGVVVQTYTSCIEKPCMRLFFALAAIHDHTVTIADTKNAFQQSPRPSNPGTSSALVSCSILAKRANRYHFSSNIKQQCHQKMQQRSNEKPLILLS